MPPVLHSALPAIPWLDPRLARLPGILPMDPSRWLVPDEAFAGQMAERDRLIAGREGEVHGLLPEAGPAAAELWSVVLARLPALGYRVGGAEAVRPDGVAVPLDPGRPLLTLGRLVQDDLCLMEAGAPFGHPGEHVLTGAILCFPASWTLAEKLGRPLVRIHAPVAAYDADIARRVQRLFDAIAPERPLWRMNWHPYASAELFHPRREADPRPRPQGPVPWLRSELQGLVRLPRTRAVVFSIRTHVVAIDRLPEAARAALRAGVAAAS
ncbi:MAG: DUF3445 domain-containing protein [Rhodobacteraceae bacterium]|nr:DUF3445 domain-containing protein [Paracoccaceae bacterium]